MSPLSPRTGSLPFPLLGGSSETCLLLALLRFNEVERGAVSVRTLPACMRRRRLEERVRGRCWRIRPFRDRVVVVWGCSMVRGKSAIEAVKRMMSCKISSGGAFAAIALGTLRASEHYLAVLSKDIIAHSRARKGC